MQRAAMFVLLFVLVVSSLLATTGSAADPSGWTVRVNSGTGKWAAVSGMTFTVPAVTKPDGSPARIGFLDTGIGRPPGGNFEIGLRVQWLPFENKTGAHVCFGFFTECGQFYDNGGNTMAAGTVTCTNDTGSVSLTVTPY